MKRSIWTAEERSVLEGLSSPDRIQAFLDGLPYSSDPFNRSPRSVLRDRVAHCFDGALFAAAALRNLGHPPLLVNLRAVNDDDHALAVFRRDGCIGSIAKSNFVGLRYREPVFRTMRGLILSYFEQYFNIDGEKTLRAYSAPLDLSSFDRVQWMVREDHLDDIAERLGSMRHYALLTPAMIASLARTDERSLRAGLLGANEAGLYRPESGA